MGCLVDLPLQILQGLAWVMRFKMREIADLRYFETF